MTILAITERTAAGNASTGYFASRSAFIDWLEKVEGDLEFVWTYTTVTVKFPRMPLRIYDYAEHEVIA